MDRQKYKLIDGLLKIVSHSEKMYYLGRSLQQNKEEQLTDPKGI